MKKKATIPTILGIIVLLLGSFAGVFLLKNTQVFRTGAEASSSPKNVRTTNVSDNSFTVTWTTDTQTAGYLVWGDTEGNISKIENEDPNGVKYFNHSITVSGANPDTKYYFKIGTDGIVTDNNGVAWATSTGPLLSASKNTQILSGNVISASGNPEKRALVYADISGYMLSTTTSDTGYYVFQIGSIRASDLTSYVTVDPAQTLIKLSVQATPDGVAAAQVFLQSGNPVPPMVIGQTYDFRSSPANSSGDNPTANLALPADSEKASKFDVSVATQSAKPTSVILESISEGEIITTTEPQFFGKAPEGTALTITVHSDEAITGSVKVPKTGSWSYAVPTNLSPGNHTITISWIDVTGITRFLTRSFVVQAAENPAFTASNSGATASPVPTLAPTVTPVLATNSPAASPTVKPSSTPTLKPTTSPKASITPIATSEPLPVSGDLTPTVLLFIMSIVVMAFSVIVWKVSDN